MDSFFEKLKEGGEEVSIKKKTEVKMKENNYYKHLEQRFKSILDNAEVDLNENPAVIVGFLMGLIYEILLNEKQEK